MKRVIMHIDMNSYFASVEQQVNPSLRGKPIAVGGPNEGRTVIAAASIEAKRFGVKSGMNIYQARKICPNLIFVQGNYSRYADFTNRIFYIFRRYTPILEIFSIDEAFLDVTTTLKTFENAIRASKEIKLAIRKEVGDWLSCSVGIAPNKLIAKLASDLKKPDGLVVVRKENIQKLLNYIELDELCGIGSKTKRNLLSMGIDTIGKLGKTPVEVLVRRFGKMGLVLHCMGKGEDESPVVPYYEIPEPKSMGHSYTLPEDTADKNIIWSTLLKLSEQVGRRLRAEHFTEDGSLQLYAPEISLE
jgi:DNA polymerase IV